MAVPLLQKARQRKMIYFGAIAVLFTLSLIHREVYLKPQAFNLQLRETARGEVELTESAVRLMLTGSRGVAVTMLWYNAMDRQKRNEWHELELLVKSITKLQPYFITPWLYQSWNISFNVAVECDRPRDKYYYITRGLELLAEGERRNRGVGDENAAADPNKIVFPGHPELRHFLGFTYQLKIGTSDERLTMRCLLEMSTIDPVERNPDNFWTTNERDEKVVKVEPFARFTQKYPRLVRRLREQLGFSDPRSIVQFLQDHQNIPNRFKPNVGVNVQQSELKDTQEQFPILPPVEGDWPDARKDNLTDESLDVFLVCRTWYAFAQKPLPPANDRPGVVEPDYDKLRYRGPKQMMIQLFRQYPARAQVYIAETLESEGFFDNSGWIATDSFEELTGKAGGEFLDDEGDFKVGTLPKYHSRLAWEKAYYDYKDYGEKNGLYFTPAQRAKLEEEAALARQELKLAPSQSVQQRPAAWRQGKRGASLDAHQRLYFGNFYRTLGNFDAFFYQAEGEKSPVTAYARKLLFEAERKRKREVPSELMLTLYDRAWPMYLRACFEFPKFAQVTSMQEDLYEIHQRYLMLGQYVRRERYKNLAVWFAHRTAGPLTTWPEAIALYHTIKTAEGEQQQMLKVVPFRKRWGPLDAVQYYDGPHAKEWREGLFMLTQGAQVAMTPNIAGAVTMPGQQLFMLTRADAWDDPPRDWQPVITEETRRVVFERPGMKR